MWLAMQHGQPDDYVVATGESHSVREFCEEAFGCAQLDYREFVRTDPRYYRPSEVEALQGDASKARKILGWAPSMTFKHLVGTMVESDLALAEAEAAGARLPRQG
jgi:GDPmannose 4,6-dehydratase